MREWGEYSKMGKEMKMSNSALITRTDYAYSGNYTQGRQEALRGIVIHHACATTIESVARTFQTPGRNGSAHYCVCEDQISLMVDENNTAWHCSNWNGNCRTIGIEVCNENLSNYDISENSFNTLVKLVAEIAKRNGFGKLEYLPDGDGTGITGHKDWVGAYTDCPGKLYPRLAEIAQKANDINYPPEPQPTPTPTPSGDFQVGDKVTLKQYVDYYGTALLKTQDYYFISQITGDRAVLNEGSVSGECYAAVNTNNLIKVSGEPVSSDIQVGDRVALIAPIDYYGHSLIITRKFYFVNQINGDRVVLCADDVNGTVYAAVRKDNLRKI